MFNFLNKAGLYALINSKFEELGINPAAENYRIDAMELAKEVCLNLQIEMLSFEETKICGILYKGKTSTTIGLNARRSLFGQNFDCMHELIHYWFHDGRANFLCTPPSPAVPASSDLIAHLEWQANEGAAQFLMPFQNFIPRYCNMHDHFYAHLSPNKAHDALLDNLAKHYMVGTLAVQYRMEGLLKEIGQYIGGAKIDDIRILARG